MSIVIKGQEDVVLVAESRERAEALRGMLRAGGLIIAGQGSGTLPSEADRIVQVPAAALFELLERCSRQEVIGGTVGAGEAGRAAGSDERERLRLREQRQEQDRLAAIGTTAAMLAHELGNPLNNLFLHAQVLDRRLSKDKTLGDDRVRTGVGSILTEIRRLIQLLDEFRALSRRQRLAVSPIDLGALIVEACDSPWIAAEHPDVQVEVELPPRPAMVMADPDKLRQVLLNLCKNGCEAMPGGGVLTVSARIQGESAVLGVRDTGHGIPEGVDVFEPFRTTKPNGTGLGLPIVRQILEAHDGNITYASEAGRGTCFSCALPRAAGA